MLTAILALFGGSGWLAFAILALRFSGLKRDRDLADIARNEQAKELIEEAEIDNEYRRRTIARLKDLEREIKQLEDELALCDSPGARLHTLNRLLQKASSARADTEYRLRKNRSSGTAGIPVPGMRRVGVVSDPRERSETD